MADKMTLLFVKHTGHILAAVTRSADPTGTLSAEDLARGGLLVRGFSSDTQFEVPPRELDVLTVDLDSALLLQPRAFFVDENQKVPVPVSSGTVNSVLLSATQVTVQPLASSPVPEDTKVWVQITGGDLTQPLIAAGTVPTGGTSVALPLVPLHAGHYDVLTFVATLPPHVFTNQVIP